MYNNMKKIYYRNPQMFIMATAHLLDIGFRKANEITDEDINELEGNGLMTQDFVQDLVRMTRDIAAECGNDVVEIIMFCMAEDIFDIHYYKKGQ